MPVSHAVTGRRCCVERVAPGTVSAGRVVEASLVVYPGAALFLLNPQCCCCLHEIDDRVSVL